MKKLQFLGLILISAILIACAPVVDEGQVLTVMTHDSFAISEALVLQFEQEHEVDVVFLQLGDTGEAVNKAVLAAGNPLAVRLSAAGVLESACEYDSFDFDRVGMLTESLYLVLSGRGDEPVSWMTVAKWVRERVLAMNPKLQRLGRVEESALGK